MPNIVRTFYCTRQREMIVRNASLLFIQAGGGYIHVIGNNFEFSGFRYQMNQKKPEIIRVKNSVNFGS